MRHKATIQINYNSKKRVFTILQSMKLLFYPIYNQFNPLNILISDTMTILPHDTPARLCSSQFRIFLAEINYSVFRALSLFSIVCKYPHVIEKNYERNEKREFIDSCDVICCSSSFCIASHNTNSILRHFNRLKLS